MTEFSRQDLSGSTFRDVNLAGADFRAVSFFQVRMRGVELCDVEISGELKNVVINGVDVAPLIAAELERRDPLLAKMRPADADGFREAWAILEELWAGTIERARTLTPDQLNASVDDEWSFLQTLRHLCYATDAWVRRAYLGDPAPWHPLDLPWDEAGDDVGFTVDRTSRPSFEEVLAVREDRVAGVREVLAGLTDERLNGQTQPVHGPGSWPPAQAMDVREVFVTVLSEEYSHRQYAERDLDKLLS
ncbi:DinB family protein [Actinoplanes sp. NPDC089786]|uniref:DinB family protein n=1 Tax=Actinoplanes sp. NPDC089786 TaxID=3155185 RepID=UPI00343D243D